MRESIAKALASLGVDKNIAEFSKCIGGSIFGSKDNPDFQKQINPIMTRKMKDLLFLHDHTNLLSAFFDINGFKNPKVISTQLISVQLYDTFVVYAMGVDIVDAKAPIDFVDSSMGKAYRVDKLVNARLELYVDVINNREFLSAYDVGLAVKTNEPRDSKDPEDGLLPSGMVYGYWSVLPNEIELLANYGKIPVGTVLTLDVDKGIYTSDKGGIPAALYHMVFSSRMSITPDPYELFSDVPADMTDDGEEDEEDDEDDAAGLLKGDAEPLPDLGDESDDGLENFFKDLKKKK